MAAAASADDESTTAGRYIRSPSVVIGATTMSHDVLQPLVGQPGVTVSRASGQGLHMRPVPGYARYRTPIRGMYLCGAGAHAAGGC